MRGISQWESRSGYLEGRSQSTVPLSKPLSQIGGCPLGGGWRAGCPLGGRDGVRASPERESRWTEVPLKGALPPGDTIRLRGLERPNLFLSCVLCASVSLR